MIGRQGTSPARASACCGVGVRRRNGPRQTSSGTRATSPVASHGSPEEASVSVAPMMPPTVHQPWKDGRIGRP